MSFINELIVNVTDLPRQLDMWQHQCNRYAHLYLDALVGMLVLLSIGGVFLYRWINHPKPQLQSQ